MGPGAICFAFEGDYVEAAGEVVAAVAVLKIALRGQAQLALLAHVNAGRGATEIPPPPVADLHEDQLPGIAHDEVEFAESAAVIGLDVFETLVNKVSQRQLFRPAARILAGSPAAHMLRPEHCR